MKNKIVACLLAFVLIISLCACSHSGNSTFSIQFIDVGQGDSALVQCDGHYMLIDGGDKSHGDTVCNVLVEKGINKLDYLVISHLHEDHYGGLTKALKDVVIIGRTLSNSDHSDNQDFAELKHQLYNIETKITIPCAGDKYKLGSAEIEVLDAESSDSNDSLVILITYGDTRFLFTGDIGEEAQKRVYQKYQNATDEAFKIDLIKMPHHGAKTDYLFIRTFMPDYAVISVGQGNSYGHPSQETLDMLTNNYKRSNKEFKLYRTDENGDIFVQSNGKRVSVTPSKGVSA